MSDKAPVRNLDDVVDLLEVAGVHVGATIQVIPRDADRVIEGTLEALLVTEHGLDTILVIEEAGRPNAPVVVPWHAVNTVRMFSQRTTHPALGGTE